LKCIIYIYIQTSLYICICIYMYACIYIFVSKYFNIFIYIYIYYVYTYTNTLIYNCIHIYTHIFAFVYKYVFIHMDTYMYKNIYAHAFTCTRIICIWCTIQHTHTSTNKNSACVRESARKVEWARTRASDHEGERLRERIEKKRESERERKTEREREREKEWGNLCGIQWSSPHMCVYTHTQICTWHTYAHTRLHPHTRTFSAAARRIVRSPMNFSSEK